MHGESLLLFPCQSCPVLQKPVLSVPHFPEKRHFKVKCSDMNFMLFPNAMFSGPWIVIYVGSSLSFSLLVLLGWAVQELYFSFTEMLKERVILTMAFKKELIFIPHTQHEIRMKGVLVAPASGMQWGTSLKCCFHNLRLSSAWQTKSEKLAVKHKCSWVTLTSTLSGTTPCSTVKNIYIIS